MKIDYSIIVTKDFKGLISQEEIENLRKNAKIDKNTLINKNTNRDGVRNYKRIANRAYEIIYFGSKYQTKNSIEKAIIYSYMAYDNNKRFAEILVKSGFDRDTLENLINLLEYIKNKKATVGLDEIDLEHENKCLNLIKKIFEKINYYIGELRPELIIIKINEILSYQPELLETNKDKKTK